MVFAGSPYVEEELDRIRREQPELTPEEEEALLFYSQRQGPDFTPPPDVGVLGLPMQPVESMTPADQEALLFYGQPQLGGRSPMAGTEIYGPPPPPAFGPPVPPGYNEPLPLLPYNLGPEDRPNIIAPEDALAARARLMDDPRYGPIDLAGNYGIRPHTGIADVLGAIGNIEIPSGRFGGSATPLEMYRALQTPARLAGEAARENIPGAPGRILGTAAEIGLDPLTLATLPLGAAAMGARQLIARGILSSLGAGVGGEVARQIGAPEFVGQVAGGGAGWFGPEIARLGGRGAGRAAEELATLPLGRAAMRGFEPELAAGRGAGGAGGGLERTMSDSELIRTAKSMIDPLGGSPSPFKVDSVLAEVEDRLRILEQVRPGRPFPRNLPGMRQAALDLGALRRGRAVLEAPEPGAAQRAGEAVPPLAGEGVLTPPEPAAPPPKVISPQPIPDMADPAVVALRDAVNFAHRNRSTSSFNIGVYATDQPRGVAISGSRRIGAAAAQLDFAGTYEQATDYINRVVGGEAPAAARRNALKAAVPPPIEAGAGGAPPSRPRATAGGPGGGTGAPPPGAATPVGGMPEEPFAANIRLSKYPEDIRAAVKAWADANPEVVQTARRGVKPDAEVLADAQALVENVGGDFKRVQNRWKPGDAWNAEEIVAIRGVLRAKSEDVLAAAEAVRAVDSTANQLKLLEAVTDHASTQEIVHGVTAEAGRGLRAFRQAAFDARTSGDIEKMDELLSRMGGALRKQGWTPQDAKQRIAALADRITTLDLDKPAEVATFLRSINRPNAGDYVMELWINSILSGPKTHIINTLSNAAFAAMSPIERGLAAAVDIPLSRLQGRAQARFFSEASADAAGALLGIPEGMRAALRTLKDGFTPAQASKWEFRRTAFPGAPGRVIRLPGTGLEAADSFFYAINYRAALEAGIVRQANLEKLTGAKLLDRIAELRLDPSPNLVKEAAKTAEYRLFRAPPGEWVVSIMRMRDTIPGLRFVVPFLRTPGDLLSAGFERSPFGLANPRLWRNIANKNPEASDQIARLLLGSGIAVGMGALVANGTIDITAAAPTSAAARDRFYREGKLPFAIRIPGVGWVQYSRLEPFNQPLAQLGSFVQAVRNGDNKSVDQIAGEIISAQGKNLVSQTYLSSLSDFIEAISNPEEAGRRFGERTATGFVPFSSALRTAAQATDPFFRRPENIVEQFKTGIPGLSEQVPPRLTAFGEPAMRQTPAWSPIQVTPSQQSRLDAELERLGFEVGFVGSTISGIKLSREEQQHYQVVAGQASERALLNLIASDAYNGASDLEKEKALESLITKIRQMARQQILKETADKLGVPLSGPFQIR